MNYISVNSQLKVINMQKKILLRMYTAEFYLLKKKKKSQSLKWTLPLDGLELP